MKTIIVAFLLLTGTWLVSCNQKQSPSQINAGTTNHLLNDSSLRFSWQVTGCAEKRDAGKSRSGTEFSEFPERQVELSPELRVAGDSISYTRVVSHLCCRQVTVSTKREKQTLTITEYWFRPGCKCKCSSTVNAVIRQLPKGEYQLYVIETGTDPVNDSPVNAADTLLRETISVQ